MAWQKAETLVEIRGTLADNRRTTKWGIRCYFPKHEFNRPACLETHHYLFKGLIMDMCVLLTSNPECVVSPCRAITRAQPETSKLKIESRAIAVGVAMSPRNLGGKYSCRPHPRPRTCTWQFFCGNQSVLIELHQSGVIAWRPWQHWRSCGVFKSWISVAHCPFERKWRVLHIWYISVLE